MGIRAFSSEVDTGSREENASKQERERFPAKWIPVRVKKSVKTRKRASRSDSIGTEKALFIAHGLKAGRLRT
jgi:hypothetical protein